MEAQENNSLTQNQQENNALTRIKSLNNYQHKNGIRDLLSILQDEDVLATAQTASNKKLLPESRNEAIDIILIYTPDIERFFSYRRITSNALTEYLHVNRVTLKAHVTRQHLITYVTNLWDKKFSQEIVQNDETQSKSTNKSDVQNLKDISSVKLYIRSDEFSRHFVEWFYSCLNSINSETQSVGNRFDASIFCSNSSVDLYLMNLNWSDEYHGKGAEDCEKLFRDVLFKFKFYFSPNLENGTQALKSAHGLVKVLSCGSLHKGGDFVGVFEQEFGLVQSPIDKNWKIFLTKANFKTSSNVSIPALPPCSVFEIECL